MKTNEPSLETSKNLKKVNVVRIQTSNGKPKFGSTGSKVVVSQKNIEFRLDVWVKVKKSTLF